MILEELVGKNQNTNNFYAKSLNKKIIKYFRIKDCMNGYILDIGMKTYFTKMLENEFDIKIFNTKGDLDIDFEMNEDYKYDTIIYSRTIEHQFNPLHTLLRLKRVMHNKSKMYIILPNRGKLLWTKYHYHEIDPYRMSLLFKRAGYRMISNTKIKGWRSPLLYMKGFRSLYRIIREHNDIYELELK